MLFETILYELQDQILTIILNRPEKLNAMTPTMLHELREAFVHAAQDKNIRVIVLTGAGRGFCAGADLGAASELMMAGNFSYEDNLNKTYNPLIMAIQRVPQPIIASVNGVAAGAGMSLALACDLRIASEGAAFLQAFVKIGLVPDSGSTWMLPRLIGMTRALELMLTGRKVGAQEAFAMGMVNQVVPETDLGNTVHSLAQSFVNAPTKTIGLIKQAVNFAMQSTLDEALRQEAAAQAAAGASVDHAEGISAFLDKRPPQFTGE